MSVCVSGIVGELLAGLAIVGVTIVAILVVAFVQTRGADR